MYYRLERPIPSDTGEACRLTRARTSAHRQAIETVLREFFELRDDGWHNVRADEEIAAYKAQCEVNRRVGQKGGRPRKTESVNKGNRNGFDHKPNRNPNHEPLTINKEKKNKGAGAFAPPEWIPADAWKAFEAHRQKMRKPMTDRARELIVAELERLRAGGHDPVTVLEQSIRKGWQDVFEVKAVSTQAPPARAVDIGKCPCGAAATMKVGGKPRCASHVREVTSEKAAA